MAGVGAKKIGQNPELTFSFRTGTRNPLVELQVGSQNILNPRRNLGPTPTTGENTQKNLLWGKYYKKTFLFDTVHELEFGNLILIRNASQFSHHVHAL